MKEYINKKRLKEKIDNLSFAFENEIGYGFDSKNIFYYHPAPKTKNIFLYSYLEETFNNNISVTKYYGTPEEMTEKLKQHREQFKQLLNKNNVNLRTFIQNFKQEYYYMYDLNKPTWTPVVVNIKHLFLERGFRLIHKTKSIQQQKIQIKDILDSINLFIEKNLLRKIYDYIYKAQQEDINTNGNKFKGDSSIYLIFDDPYSSSSNSEIAIAVNYGKLLSNYFKDHIIGDIVEKILFKEPIPNLENRIRIMEYDKQRRFLDRVFLITESTFNNVYRPLLNYCKSNKITLFDLVKNYDNIKNNKIKYYIKNLYYDIYRLNSFQVQTFYINNNNFINNIYNSPNTVYYKLMLENYYYELNEKIDEVYHLLKNNIDKLELKEGNYSDVWNEIFGDNLETNKDVYNISIVLDEYNGIILEFEYNKNNNDLRFINVILEHGYISNPYDKEQLYKYFGLMEENSKLEKIEL